MTEGKITLHYPGFDWIPGGGENGYYIDGFDYEVDAEEVAEIVSEFEGGSWDDLKQAVLSHFEEEAQEYAIEQYKKGE